MFRTEKRSRRLLSRRKVLTTSFAVATAVTTLSRPSLAQSKPEKLVFVGDTGPWHWTLMEEVAPEFYKSHGIRVEFNRLPIDALNARLRAELGAGTGGIDIAQWISYWGGWISPFMEDHEELLRKASGAASSDYDWNDILPATKALASFDGKLLGIPYRAIVSVLHYQRSVLDAAGIRAAPQNWDDLLKSAVATTRAGLPQRFGYGLLGRQGPAIIGSYTPFLYSNGGFHFDSKSLQVAVNDGKAIEALQFLGELVNTHKVVPPEALTWEYDEIIANGQSDRYAMTTTLAPYATLMNDPSRSRTGGLWSSATVPGRHRGDEGRTWLNGWTFGVPKSCKHKQWAFEFIQLATTKAWQRRSMERGNAPVRQSVLSDPAMIERFSWAAAASSAMLTARPDPNHPIWPTLDVSLRSGISAVLTGQKSAKAALDDVALEWERALRRASLAK